MTVDAWKRAAAEYAVQFVESGMVIGLGAGSTARIAIQLIAERLSRGELSGIRGVPCSRAVGLTASQLGIPLAKLDVVSTVDLTIDGADEVDPSSLALIKGAGGALLHEKIVAQASQREMIIVDAGKPSDALGTHQPVPVEVVPFGWRDQAGYLELLGAQVRVRTAPEGTPFYTDEQNLILDCAFGAIEDPRVLARMLDTRTGIVEHGLFIDLATDLIIAGDSGVQHIMRTDSLLGAGSMPVATHSNGGARR